MALIDSVSKTTVTVPRFIVGKPNGKLDATILRAPDGSTSTNKKMFVPVSYAMQALSIASKGVSERSVGRYRTYVEQENLFRSRYTTSYLAGRPYKMWNGKRWYQRAGTAMAAVPGTSNHGLGLADDVAEERDGDSGPESMSDAQLIWMRDNAPKYGFGLESRLERWHWHWIGGNALSQVVVDTLYRAGVSVPDMSKYGFTVPKPGSGGTTPTPTPTPTSGTAPTPPGYPSFKLGAADASTVVSGWSSGRVTALQGIMGITADGQFGAQTDTKLRELQRTGGITVDGVYGRQCEAKFVEWRGA